MSCGVGPRCGSDPSLLWLWCRPAAAAPIGPLVWKLPYAMGAALKSKTKTNKTGVPIMAQRKRIRLGTMRLQVQSLALLSIAVSCGVGCRRGSDLALLWLWLWLAATSHIILLGWEPPCNVGTAVKRQKTKGKKKKEKKEETKQTNKNHLEISVSTKNEQDFSTEKWEILVR